MSENAKRGKISQRQLFSVLLLLRMTAALGDIGYITLGTLSSDTLLSLALGCGLTLLFALPLYFCCVKHKSPLNTKLPAMLYAVYFVLLEAFNIASFSLFSTSESHPETKTLLIVILISLAAGYAAYLGIEAVSRFSVFCVAFLAVVIAVAVFTNVKNLERLNYYPLMKNSKAAILENAVLFASNSTEVVIFASLAPRVNGKRKMPLFSSIAAAFAGIIFLAAVCVGVMGYATEHYPYPVYSLFKMSSIGSFSRMDVIHTAFWIFAFVARGAVLVYCASNAVKRLNHSVKSIAFSAVSGVLAFLLCKFSAGRAVYELGIPFRLISLAVFQLILPAGFLIFKRRNKGEALLEAF